MDVQRPFDSSHLSEGAIEMHLSAFLIEEQYKASFRLQTTTRRFRLAVEEDRPFDFHMDRLSSSISQRRRFVSDLMSLVRWTFNGDAAFRFWTSHVHTCYESALTHLLASNLRTGLHRGLRIVIRLCVHEVVHPAASAADADRTPTRLKYDGGRFGEKDCAICLVEYETDGEDLILMPCSHSFHIARVSAGGWSGVVSALCVATPSILDT